MHQLPVSSSPLCSGWPLAIGCPLHRHSGRTDRVRRKCFQRRAHARLVVLGLGKLQEAR